MSNPPFNGSPCRRLGMVARWQPVHLGHLPVLRGLCRSAGQALIGIGSCNEHTLRAPFYLEETQDMLRLALQGFDNYTLVPVADLHDGPRWRGMVCELFGELDAFVTENPYVASLMQADYPVLHPARLVLPEERTPIDGTQVRLEMARGGNWQALLPPQVAQYLTENRLDERFRREFGLETLAMQAIRQN